MTFPLKLAEIWQAIVDFFQKDVLPEAEAIEQAFLSQFKTDGGKIVFNAVTAFIAAASSADGIGPIVVAAEAIGASLLKEGLELAGQDLKTVILNALRVHVEAAQIAAPIVAPPVKIPAEAPAA